MREKKHYQCIAKGCPINPDGNRDGKVKWFKNL